MKKEYFIVIFFIIPTFYLYSQTSLNDQIIINKSTIKEVNLLSTEKIFWHQNHQPSQLEFIEHLIDENFRRVSSVYSADVDDDGDVDVLGAAELKNEIAWWENLDIGSGSFYKHTIDNDFHSADKVYAADIDGDGDIDVLGGGYQGNEVAWWENTEAGTFSKHLIDGDFKRSVSVWGIDMDSDGDMDVLGASKLDNDIVWWENDGSENFTKKIVDSNFLSVSRIHASDIDGDGDIDVVGVRSSQIAWWENDGTQNFSKHLISANLRFGYGVFAIDLDSDGDVDVLSADLYGNEIAWWENDGSQNFTKDSLDAEISRPYGFYITDLDNDNDVDILAVSGTDNYVCWYENMGSKIFDKHIVQTGVNSARAVHANDFDNDGDIDILGATSYFYWWENTLLTNPNPLIPDIFVEPDSLFFYVGSGEKMVNYVPWSEYSSDYLQQPIVLNEQSGFEDTVAVKIKNIGDATLYVQNISSESEWIIDVDTTNFLLLPEQEQMVTIMCSAEDLFNGMYEGILTVNSNDPETPVLDLPLMLEMRAGLDVNFVDEIEPNNSETEAQKIYPPSPAGIKGNISVSEVGGIYLSALNDDIEDLYEFKIQSGSIKIKLYDFTADLDFFLMQIAGNTITIWGSNHRGAPVDEEFEKTDLVPGTYFVGISIYDYYPIQNTSSYSLVLSGDIFSDLPSTPMLNSPSAEANNQPTTLTLKWHPATGADKYHLQVSKSSQFETTVFDDSAITTTFQQVGPLESSTTYYWRVKANNTGGSSDWSEVWSFTTIMHLPNRVELISPENNAIMQETSIDFIWKKSNPNVIVYWFEYADNSEMTNSVIDSAISDTAITISNMDLDQSYYWRVRAKNFTGWGSLSEIRKFTIMQLPAQVVLISPEHDAILHDQNVEFVWDKSNPNVNNYCLEYSNNFEMTNSVIDSTISDTTLTISAMDLDQSYFWRVKANNLAGWGTLSETRKFSIFTTGVNSESNVPKEFALHQNYPNPFNSSTTINFSLPKPIKVTITLYDILGQEVDVLINRKYNEGNHQLSYSANELLSGVYLYKIEAGDFIDMKKLIVLK